MQKDNENDMDKVAVQHGTEDLYQKIFLNFMTVYGDKLLVQPWVHTQLHLMPICT